MNVLFLTMNVFTDIEMHNIYSDLMKEFIKHGHRPYIVTPREKKLGEKTELINYDDYSLLKVQIGNTSDVSLIEKGISTVTLSSRFYNAVKDKLGKISFGLILYSTPPITLATPVKRLKKLFGCRTYLMLKDIFPQNAVDLGMFSEKGFIYRYFRAQEKKLYKVSDKIGCMSPANVEYVMKHNPEIPQDKVEICPNAIIPHEVENRESYKRAVRERYGIPDQAIVYLYGGNLGKPQGIPFLLECLKRVKNDQDGYFIICGSGSEYGLLKDFMEQDKPENVRLISFLPKKDYDTLVKGCDVGLVFLDHRFTIPNFPSRALSYLECSMPILACTDTVTDIGRIAVENRFGFACESNDSDRFADCVHRLTWKDVLEAGNRARNYLEKFYTAEHAYRIVMGEENEFIND